jgi:hypothetical protein
MAVRDTHLESWPVHTPGGRTYRVFYTYTEDQVTLHSIRELVIPETSF